MKSNIKMVVTDLDGTLLKRDKTLSEYSKIVIKRFMEEGNVFAIATSRPFNVLQELVQDISYDAAICHNGVRTILHNKELTYYGIDNSYNIIKELISFKPNIHIGVCKDQIMYANFEIDKLMTNCPYKYTNTFSEIENILVSTIIIEVDNPAQLQEYKGFIPDLYYLQIIEERIGIVLNRCATKLNGILQVINKKNISLENVYAFGDDYNDIEMIKACGVGIAMENAIQPVKNQADLVCKSNDADGVAHWIENNLLT